jgi:hypothetical protein
MFSNNSFTVREDGIYDLRGKIQTLNPGQNNVIFVQIRRNGNKVLTQNSDQTSTNQVSGVETSGYRQLSEGDDIELWIDDDDGKTIDIGADQTELSLARQGV